MNGKMEESKEIKKFVEKLDALAAQGVGFNREAILEAKQLELMDHTSFSIKIIALLGGILGSFTLLGAIYTMGINSIWFDLICAVLFWSGTFWVHTKRKQIVYDTILICMVLMATYFSYMVLSDLNLDSTLNNAFLILLIGGVCLYFFKNELLAFLGSLGVLIALFVLALEMDAVWGANLYFVSLLIFTTLLFLKESVFLMRGARCREIYKPLRLASILVVFGVLGYTSSLQFMAIFIPLNGLVLASVYGCLVWTVVVMSKEQQLQGKRYIVTIALVGGLLAVPMYMSFGFGFSVLLILLCFRTLYVTGLVLALLSFCYYLFLFYYDLSYTLMVKSLLLMGTGLILWGLYVVITKKTLRDEY